MIFINNINYLNRTEPGCKNRGTSVAEWTRMGGKQRIERLTLAAAMAAMVLAPGCLADPDTIETQAEAIDGPGRETKIWGGQNDVSHTGVVAVGRNGQPHCSGTLIAPNLVLTAQHCVADIFGDYCGQSPFGAPWSGMEIRLGPNAFDTFAPTHAVSEVRTPPGGNDTCGYDVALLILASDASTGAQMYAPRLDDAVQPGEGYYAVGYGDTVESLNQPAGDYGFGIRRFKTGLFAKCSGLGCGDPGVTDSEWVGSGATCRGDSGGPAFDLQDRVIGVTSRGAAPCHDASSIEIYGGIHAFRDWIRAVAVEAAQRGGYSPAPWAAPQGAAPSVCQQPSQCGFWPNGNGGTEDCGACDPGMTCGADGYCAAPTPPPPDEPPVTEPEPPAPGITPQGQACVNRTCPLGYGCVLDNGDPGFCTQLCGPQAPSCPSGLVCNFLSGSCVGAGPTPLGEEPVEQKPGEFSRHRRASPGGCSMSSEAPRGSGAAWWLALGALGLAARRRRG